MSSFISAIESFIDAINDKKSWVEEINEYSLKVSALYSEASPAEIDDALHRFSLLYQRATSDGNLTQCHQWQIRQKLGGDPEIAGSALLEKLSSVCEAVTDFSNRCRALAEADKELIEELRPVAADNAGEDIDADALTPAEIIEDHINNEGWQDLAQRFGPGLFKISPSSVLSHMADEYFRLGLIAHLSRSKKLRRAAREHAQFLEQTRIADEAAGLDRSYLEVMLQVLDDEQLVVLHVEQGKGFEIRISGIAGNFQLHTLLADALICATSEGMVTGEAPSDLAVAQCRDAEVSNGGGEHVTGAFNLWNWNGIQADGCLPSGHADSHHWISGEGCPADIYPFEERRVVLLGRPSYQRFWVAGRTFSGMSGEMTVERRLSDTEVESWLNRLAKAAHPAVSNVAASPVLKPLAAEVAPRAKPWWQF